MASIVDMIAQAENEAENIKNKAIEDSKKRISEANEECEKAEKAALAEVRQLMLLRRESAEHSGAALASDIIELKEKESSKAALQAEKNIDKAVKFIIERVTRI